MLPIVGVVSGALLQHFLSRSKEAKFRSDDRRHEAYADFLRGIAGIATAKNAQSMAPVIDAKARIAIYGSKEVILALAEFAQAGSDLSNDNGKRAFTVVADAMRRDSQSSEKSLKDENLRLLLFGLPRA